MAFLDSFKKKKKLYLLLVSMGSAVVVFNNSLQFLEFIRQDKWLGLLSIILFIFTVTYAFKNKEEVLK